MRTTINGISFDYDRMLGFNECFTNKTDKCVTVRLKYTNCLGEYQIDNRSIEPGHSFQLTSGLNRAYVIL